MSRADKLAAWRRAVVDTEQTDAGSVARQDAERTERRAGWDYEDDIRADYGEGREQSATGRLRREADRRARRLKDAADLRIRPRRLADEAEFRRELGEPLGD